MILRQLSEIFFTLTLEENMTKSFPGCFIGTDFRLLLKKTLLLLYNTYVDKFERIASESELVIRCK